MQIVWRGSFLDSLGYSQAARGQVLALDALGYDVKIENINYYLPRVALRPEVQKKLEYLMKKDYTKDFVYVNHTTPNLFVKKNNHPTIGNTYWETSRMLPLYVEKCNEMDRIFVPTRHNVHVLKESGVTVSVDHIRQGIEMRNLQPSRIHSPLSALGELPAYKFLSVFSWTPRKGYDILLQAYFEEFTKWDDVCLIIKTNKMGWGHSPQNKVITDEIAEIKEKIVNPETAPLVYVVTEIFSEEQMIHLFQECQAFVLPSRGEALGLPYLEAGSFGLPVIATGWGGQTDFLTENNSHLVDYQLVPIPEKWYTGHFNVGQCWAEPNKQDLRRKMRMVFQNREKSVQKGNLLRDKIKDNYSYEKSALDIVRVLGG